MEWINTLFEESTHLTAWQMIVRGIVVFVLALIMLRMAGKRTFGKQSASDNVIMIMLGALLTRAITGASPFVPVILASFAIVLFHRLLAWACLKNKKMGLLIKGENISLFKYGKENKEKMNASLISEEDMMEGVRTEANLNSLDNVEEIFIERNGRISIVKK